MDVLDSPITEEEIMRAVEHLNSNKSPRIDGILANAIKNSLPQIVPVLVQSCFQYRSIPNCMHRYSYCPDT